MNEGIDCELTILGWQRLEPVRKVGGEPGTCFVAMWFALELAEAYEFGMLPAIEQNCGMKAVRIDRVEHNNRITDGILAGFAARSSGSRVLPGIDPGFTMMRDLLVVWGAIIYCCRSDSFEARHFDTSVINHIVWADPTDLRSKLANRIRTTILPKA